MTYTYRPQEQRCALIDWMAESSFTHGVTLNTDRQLSISRLEDIFSTFCHRFDKRVHRVRNMRRFPIELRLNAIVFPEHLTTNAHLHGFADFRPALDRLGNELLLRQTVRGTWLQTTRGAGSVHFERSSDRGWGRYSTKKLDGTYFLAADFHPD